MKKINIKTTDFENKRVLVRVDFNVPLDEKGEITSDNRIIEALPTINFLIQKGAKVILCSHLGRPDGKIVLKYSLHPVYEYLKKILPNTTVLWADECIGKHTQDLIKSMQKGNVILLENLRFFEGEEKNEKEFAENLAELADYHIDDAFGTSHRKHASNYGVSKLLPSGEGFLMQKEKKMLDFSSAERPIVAVLGGAKVSDKIELIEALLNVADKILIGGAMASTFLCAMGGSLGDSKVEMDKLKLIDKIMQKSKEKKVEIVLPVDSITTTDISGNGKTKVSSSVLVHKGFSTVDIGPKTRKLFAKIIKGAKTVFWNGPMGIFEIHKFEKGTKTIAKAMAKCKGKTIVGGGDSESAVKKYGYTSKITFVSSGGGATLDYIGKNAKKIKE